MDKPMYMSKSDQGLFEHSCSKAIVQFAADKSVLSMAGNRHYALRLMQAMYESWWVGRTLVTVAVEPTNLPVPDSTGVAVVDTNYHWLPMRDCPKGAKVQVLGIGGTATHTVWDGKAEWLGWTPLPTSRRE